MARWRGTARSTRSVVMVAGIAALSLAQENAHAAAVPHDAASPSNRASVRWVSEAPDTNRAIVEVTGLSASALRHLRQADWKAEQWQRVLAVRAEQGDLTADIGLPPMVGTYRVTADALRFEPQFPLETGVDYRATFQPNELPGEKKSDTRPVSVLFRRPAGNTQPSTVVTQIYPTTNVVPENLLKFYLHFSAPMSGGHIYEHIHLLNEAAKPVDLPFLEIDEELWNPEMTRLTLFIDPGRIKRGVKPLEEIGPALEEGKSFTLLIDPSWKDGGGTVLKESFRKVFRVGPPDREPPDPARWKVLPPKPGSREPLIVSFPKPMDHALAQRMIRVTTANGGQIEGSVGLEEQERRWAFVPDEAWRPGSYHLVVQTTIEDLAGNNIGKPFEVDVFDRVQQRPSNPSVTVPFAIR